ncbi:MAG: hypothetical protein KBT20_02700 [Bacteroidales bacterium]|nr:hypothetical protein [Candidatus Liminaster caballi]
MILTRISPLCLALPMLVLFLASCRHDEFVIYEEVERVGGEPASDAMCSGLYLLNEGNMGSNHSTLDYLDLLTGTYHRNIYAQRNPSVVRELGDVGNDIQVYGSRLWMVINCSNKVEVARVSDAVRLGQVDVPNCRYVAFAGGYAYISSYVGPVALGGDVQLGRVYKVDTLTLQKVDSVTVGYQPEQMAVVGDRLYVANSGGYRLPVYDNTLSVVRLSSFAEECRIRVGVNLHRVESDRYGQLWVSSRGNYADIPPRLYCLAMTARHEYAVVDSLELSVSDMQVTGDTLWYFGKPSSSAGPSYGIIDVRTHRAIDTHLFDGVLSARIAMPYGILVDRHTRDFYLMDAKNYVSNGELLHFLPDGRLDWRMRTGDIPSCGVLVGACLHDAETDDLPQPSDLLTVDEYVPAPGQFVNMMPRWDEGDDALAMAEKCTSALNGGGVVSLGGFGGYVTFHFDRSVTNVADAPDFAVFGNAHDGASEPGIVMVSIDTNHNGVPDDEWYELSGSADTDSLGRVTYGYEVTYERQGDMAAVPWTDNLGRSGIIARNPWHNQEYFPQWLDSPLRLGGTLLPPNGSDLSHNGSSWVLSHLRYGYVDNRPNTDTDAQRFDLDWAVSPVTRQPVRLSHADFIRVYSAQNQVCGWLGETSTEVTGASLNIGRRTK